MSYATNQLIWDAIWAALDSEQSAPHSGVDPEWVVKEFISKLRSSGIALVELPKPESDDYGDSMVKVALTSDSPSAKQAKIRIEDRGFGPELLTTCVPNPLKVADGVAYAASILSAVAAAAERDSEER